MKTKKIIGSLILFFLLVISLSSLVKCDGGFLLDPSHYRGIGTNIPLDFGDNLTIHVSASAGVDVYFMTNDQINQFASNPSNQPEAYYKKWLGTVSLLWEFTIAEYDLYHFLFINTGSQQISVNWDIDTAFYSPPEPEEPETIYIYQYRTIYATTFSTILILALATSTIILGILLIKKIKKIKCITNF